MITVEMLIDKVPEHLNMVSEPEPLQDFYISSKEPDIGPVIVGMLLTGAFSSPFLFIALISLLNFFFL